MTADLVGDKFGNYHLKSLLGRGGFAEVYLGEHIHLGMQAAIKVLHTQLVDHETTENFHKEARLVAQLRHTHIIRILDCGIESTTPFLVMDYAPQSNLRRRHSKRSIIPLETVIDYAQQIADALSYAHSQKVVHRDIKPENMLIGQNNEILLGDFGIAIIAQSTCSRELQDLAGTITYIAPEQLQGNPCYASDQY